MKKIWILILIVVLILSLYSYSSSQKKASLPKPEDMAGREASAFLPQEVEGKPAAKGSEELKLTGPVWISQ